MKNTLLTSSRLLAFGATFLCMGSSIVMAQTDVTSNNKVISPAESVNTFLGTAEHGHTFPGAAVPFGMVQLSPDTPQGGWDSASGYHYSQSTIRGFSHTHFLGTGISGLGDILVMPTVGQVDLNSEGGRSYWSPFSHSNETGNAGYYSVFLDKPRVKAELTATKRAGFHKYTFPQTDNAHIVLDLVSRVDGSPQDLRDAELKVENSTTVSGYRVVGDWGGDRNVYFVLQFSKPFDSFDIQTDGKAQPAGTTTAKARLIKAMANFKTTANEAVLVKVGISSTGVEGARKNLTAEIPAWDFDGAHAAAKKVWNDTLNSISIETPDPKIRRTFYSNMYFSLLTPTLFNDVDRTYTGADRKNHVGTNDYYTLFSLWDTFRAQMPLLNLIEPQKSGAMVDSITKHYEQFGRKSTPVWTNWGNEAWVMIGYHSAPVVVDAYLKGVGGFDPEKAYQALKGTALSTTGRPDSFAFGEYVKQGYINSSTGAPDTNKQSVSRTLEYAYDDWCIAKMAEKLGHKEDAAMFYARAANYRNVFDTTVGFMRGRKADGSWRRPFNPKQLVHADYTEANAWQSNWTVMQDVPGLINITGGDKAFISKMDAMFNEKDDVMANIPDITGLIGQYAHGNEPVHHVAYLYNYAGAPYKTAERVREVMRKFYDDTPAGQPGNNDAGQTSAWYVFSAIGFYPVNSSGGTYEIGSPLVNRAVLNLPNGKKFTILAQNNSAQNMYVQSARLNGKSYNKSFLSYSDIVKGGEFVLNMGAKPNLKWGRAKADRPVSGMPKGFKYAALPTPSTTGYIKLNLPIKVAAGSDDPIGDFVADPNMTEGSVAGDGNVTIDVSAPDAGPAGIYQFERYGQDFSYIYPVPAGKYQIKLHFAEVADEEPGMRFFNVTINGQPALTNFEVYAAAGGINKAVVKTFPNITPDAKGNIVIRTFATPSSPDQNAKINGIEIKAQ
ncbi:glycoside hydrolase family 92 protein [bacterium]|nr:MAG: glycoside hydrolase family 92 protein [bacterium]